MLRDAEGRPPHGYRLRVLGGWHLDRDGEPLHVPIRSQRLIAYLAVAGPSPRAVLCGRLWPTSTEPRARDSLRVAVHHVGRDLPGLLSRQGTMLALAPAVAVDLDQERSGLTGADGTAAIGAGGHLEVGGRFGRDPELLPGWYEEWVLDEQDRLRAQRIRHYAGTAQRLLETGEMHGAADFASRALAVDSLDEWALEVLVRAHLGRGALCAAQRALATFRRQLHDEFGHVPSPLLEQLQRLVAVPATTPTARSDAGPGRVLVGPQLNRLASAPPAL